MSAGKEIASTTVFIDNDRGRVTDWRFPPGAATGPHRHEMDYVVVPLTDGALRLVDPSGAETTAELERGVPYYRGQGIAHDVVNDNPFEFAFIEIEIKPSYGDDGGA
jgi:hypothetical protein